MIAEHPSKKIYTSLSSTEDSEITPTALLLSSGSRKSARQFVSKTEYRAKCETLHDVANYLSSNTAIRLVDACFCDGIGQWHHCTFAADVCTASRLYKGLAFDGSSIPILANIVRSDLIMIPDPTTCWVDPFCESPTLHITCSIAYPDGSMHEKCPRNTLERCRRFLKEAKLADEVLFGPEAEFFVFNSVRYDVQPHHVEFHVDGEEAYWNDKSLSSGGTSGVPTHLPHLDLHGRNLGHRSLTKKSYMTSRPTDSLADLRSAMLLMLADLGMTVEKHHHEAATCQVELDFRCDDVLKMADNFMTMKYVVKNVARANGKTVTFMPKPISIDNGSGMHCNQSLWKNGINLFFDANSEYCKLSTMAMHYIAGILHHAPAVLAFCCPTVNSYRRLVPGFEAPTRLTYSKGNRTAAIRIPNLDIDDPRTKRIEFRTPDASCCPYLGFAAQIMAGIDGVLEKTEPPEPADIDLGKSACASEFPLMPTSLDEALDALEKDHQFLLRGDVFNKELIDDFITMKREEARSFKGIPHPREFSLYYGC